MFCGMKVTTLGGLDAGKTTLIAAIAQRQPPTLKVMDEVADAKGWHAGVLVVSATDGPLAKTRDDVKAAQHCRVPKLVVYLNKCDLIDKGDEELLDLIEMEIRDILMKYGYNGDNAVVIRGSALEASRGDAVALQSIDKLLAALA